MASQTARKKGMSTIRSIRCCPPKGCRAFGTVSIDTTRTELHIRLSGTPCCATEFASLTAALATLRAQLAPNQPFYLVYTLDGCILQPAYMHAQEQLLHGAAACAIVVAHPVLRAAVKVATVSHGPTIKVYRLAQHAVAWIGQHRATVTDD